LKGDRDLPCFERSKEVGGDRRWDPYNRFTGSLRGKISKRQGSAMRKRIRAWDSKKKKDKSNIGTEGRGNMGC